MRKLLGASVAVIALMMSAASAHAGDGWYGRFDVGYSVDGELDLDEFGSADLDNDVMVSGAVGARAWHGVRLEAEVAWRQNDIEDAGDADVQVVSLLANAIYDFNQGGRFQPYVGAGVGVGRLEIDEIDTEETGFAYQLMAGVGVPLGEQLTLDIGYRYFSMPDVEFSYYYYAPARLAEYDEGEYGYEVEGDYTHQAVTVGLRWQFAAPPPPPEPPPPPPEEPPPPPPVVCPAEDFVVYFEWDRSNLNQDAIATIDAAVARAQACNLSAVVVIGHTDTSGSHAYNEGLSQRRATVVADALVERGIPAEAISTQARGETDLATDTGDGVREPLNRRTAVTISFQ
ncbi:MAG: OmpA family protein [Hyphomonadaceae bacterium]